MDVPQLVGVGACGTIMEVGKFSNREILRQEMAAELLYGSVGDNSVFLTYEIIETERLFLREMTSGDFDALYKVLAISRTQWLENQKKVTDYGILQIKKMFFSEPLLYQEIFFKQPA